MPTVQPQQPVYEDTETPPPRPTGQTPERRTPFAHLPTDYLNRVQKDLRSNIPSDPTFMAHVGTLLRALVQHDLSDPARAEADKAELERIAHAREQQEQAALAAKHEAELAAAPEEQHQELQAKHDAELLEADRRKQQADLAVKQAQDRAAFEQHQAEERAALAAPAA